MVAKYKNISFILVNEREMRRKRKSKRKEEGREQDTEFSMSPTRINSSRQVERI
jgi:hypothetical protein